MKLSEITTLLSRNLPQFTNGFGVEKGIASASYLNGVVTINSPDHGVKDDSYVSLYGIKEKYTFSSIERVPGELLATATTLLNNPVVLDHLKSSEQPPVEIAGAADPAYNGFKQLYFRETPKKFTYNLTEEPGSPSDTGYLLWSISQYNGLYKATVIDDDNFSYPVEKDLPIADVADGKFQTDFRIIGIADETKIETYYSEQEEDNLTIFVSLGDFVAFRSPWDVRDTVERRQGQYFSQSGQETFSIFLMIPSSNDDTGRSSRDLTEVLRPILFKCVLSYSPESGFFDEAESKIIFLNDGIHLYNGAYYAHRFNFTVNQTINPQDTTESLPDPYSAPFVDCEIYLGLKNG
jgi:hypothetical protein